VVPVRNEEGSLAALVESIRGQTRAPDEIVLVDGGSTDRTVALAPKLHLLD
jgi:glycosyltransferase involved in cell wall biosynthesis